MDGVRFAAGFNRTHAWSLRLEGFGLMSGPVSSQRAPFNISPRGSRSLRALAPAGTAEGRALWPLACLLS